MAKESYLKEKESHEKLLELLKKHFFNDERDMLEDDIEEGFEEEEDFEERKDGYEELEDDEFEEDGEGSEELEDGEYQEDDSEDVEDEKLSKQRRKDLAVLVVGKKAGKKK